MVYENRESSIQEEKAKKLIGKTFTVDEVDSSILETFDYEYPAQDISVEYSTTEFTCVCPYSGLPDFACMSIVYTPAKKCLELKSLKFYLYSFRQVKSFNEHVVNKILSDLVKVCAPKEMKIVAEFTVRGGIKTKVEVAYRES